MATATQDLLKEAWVGGKTGTLSALQQARAWALREVWKEQGKPDYGLHAYIARKVTKIGGGHPQSQAVAKFLSRLDEDPEWFPGKDVREKSGPASVISPQNQAVAASAAMAMYKRGEEPTYAKMVAACPQALQNPETGEPVGKKRVYSIMKELCYDDPAVPEDTWTHGPRHSKVALTSAAKRLRFDWSGAMQRSKHTPAWLYEN